MSSPDEKIIREMAEWKLRVHETPNALFSGERAEASKAWARAAHPRAILEILDRCDELRRERDEARDTIEENLRLRGEECDPELEELSRRLNTALNERDAAIAALDELTAQVELKSPVTNWSDNLANVMRVRYAREAEQWKANHDQRKAERDDLRREVDRLHDSLRSLLERWCADDNTETVCAILDEISSITFYVSDAVAKPFRDAVAKEPK